MLPALINHGKADTITSPSGAKALLEGLGRQEKTLFIYPGLKHELLYHCPAERAKVVERTCAWLKQQCETKTL